MCKEFGVLPYQGGLYEQSYGHILRMEAVLDAQVQKEKGDLRKAEAQRRLDKRVQEATPPANELAD